MAMTESRFWWNRQIATELLSIYILNNYFWNAWRFVRTSLYPRTNCYLERKGFFKRMASRVNKRPAGTAILADAALYAAGWLTFLKEETRLRTCPGTLFMASLITTPCLIHLWLRLGPRKSFFFVCCPWQTTGPRVRAKRHKAKLHRRYKEKEETWLSGGTNPVKRWRKQKRFR